MINFEYFIELNKMVGCLFNDFMQYFVFFFVLVDFGYEVLDFIDDKSFWYFYVIVCGFIGFILVVIIIF